MKPKYVNVDKMSLDDMEGRVEHKRFSDLTTKEKLKKIGIGFVFFVILAVMSAWGIGGLVDNSKEHYIAKIGNEVITETHLGAAIAKMQKRIPDPSFYPYIKSIALQDLILSKIIIKEAEQMHLKISDKLIAKYISSDDKFLVDSKFDAVKFNAFLSENELSEEEYIEKMRNKMVTDVIIGIIGLPKTDFSNLSDYYLKFTRQKRIVDIIEIKDKIEDVNLTEEELSDFYLSHKNIFTTKPSATIKTINSNDIEDIKNVTVTKNEIDEEFEKIYGGKFAERRSVYILTLSSKEDAENAIFLIRNRKKTFEQVASIFDKKLADILVENVGYFDFPANARDIIFDLPVNKASSIIESSDGKFIVAQVVKISVLEKNAAEKRQIVKDIVKNIRQQKICEKTMLVRDTVRDIISSGKGMDDIATYLSIKPATKDISEFNINDDSKVYSLDSDLIHDGYIDIKESSDCSFDIMAFQNVKKARDKDFSEAYQDIKKELYKIKNEENNINRAQNIKNQLLKIDINNHNLLSNFIKGSGLQIIKSVAIGKNTTTYGQRLLRGVFSAKKGDIIGPIEIKQGVAGVAILRNIEPGSGYSSSDIASTSEEIFNSKQNDMQELYKNYLYKKYNVVLYGDNKK